MTPRHEYTDTTNPQLRNYRFESSLQRTVLAPIFFVWAIAEVHRFYLGYKGNIKEMVILNLSVELAADEYFRIYKYTS